MTRLVRPAHAVTTEYLIGLHHCDLLGVAWHGRYFEWLEQARAALFASVDLDVPQIRAMGHRLYVVDAQCRYMAPLSYGDTARITAWFVEVQPLIRVAYDVRNAATGRWSARAKTVLAATAADGTLLVATPAVMLARLPAR
ncbi:MAG: acyl-CoA thioesterase [Planctomycetota bacterium]